MTYDSEEIAPSTAEAIVGMADTAFGAADGPSGGENARWDEPIPLGAMPAVPAFAWDMLPPSVSDYVRDVSDRQGSPPEFIAVSLIGAFAGVVGNGIRIAPRSCDDWAVVPALWGMLIGEASMMKTPSIQAGLMPLDDLQTRLDRDYAKQREGLVVEMELARLLNQELASQAKLALRARNLEEAHRLLSMRPQVVQQAQIRLQVGDVSETRMVQLLAENPFGLLAVHDELPAFFSRLIKRSGSSERAMLLKAATGDVRHSHDRAGRARLDIPHLTLSLLGGIQPARLTAIVRDANGNGADGLLARFQLSVWPDPAPDRQGIDRRPDVAAAEAVRAIFRDAYDCSRGSIGPKILRCELAAQDLFDRWSARNLAEAATRAPALQSHLVKSVKTIASLALLIELMGGGRQQVSFAGMQMALRWAPFLAAHAERLYALGASGTAEAERILDKRLHLPDCFTARDIYRSSWSGLGKAAVEKGLHELFRHGYLRPEIRATGGRPTTVYVWNPRLSDPEVFADKI